MKPFEKSVYILFLAYGLHCTQSHCGGGDPLSITFGLARGDYPVGLGEAGDSYCGCIIVTDHEAQLRGAEMEFHA